MQNCDVFPPRLVLHTLKGNNACLYAFHVCMDGDRQRSLSLGSSTSCGRRLTGGKTQPLASGRENDGHTPPSRRKHVLICIIAQGLENGQIMRPGKVSYIAAAAVLHYLLLCSSCNGVGA